MGLEWSPKSKVSVSKSGPGSSGVDAGMKPGSEDKMLSHVLPLIVERTTRMSCVVGYSSSSSADGEEELDRGFCGWGG